MQKSLFKVLALAVVLIVLVVAAASFLRRSQDASPTLTAPASPDVRPEGDTATHVGSFSFSYPTEATLYAGANKEAVRGLTYIPVCDPDTMTACLYFSNTWSYPGSTYSGGAVSLSVLSGDQKACAAVDLAQKEKTTEMINGVAYDVYHGGDAAAGHYLESYVYRAWHNNQCVELKSSIASTNIDVYEPGAIKEFTDEQRRALFDRMHGLLLTVSVR